MRSLPAASLVTSRDQRQTLYRWNRFVLGDDYIKEVTRKFPRTKEKKTRQKNTFDLVETVHEAEIGQLKPVEPAHRFEVTLEEDTCTDEKFLLYKDYQTHVHRDEPNTVTRSGFERFLCNSPLKRRTMRNDGKKNGGEQLLGSYHQCYRLDGRLIAIGVLDLLPHAVSGVYFIYHQDFEKWSFGKLSAMRETALALERGYDFYYMGYYIHDCVKMRYKADYKPQFVLDPETYGWTPLDAELRSLLDSKKYVSLSRQRGRAELPGPPISAMVNAASTANTAVTDVGPPPVEEGNDGSELEYTMPDPKDAADGSLSLLALGMPGVMDASSLREQIDLSMIQILLRGGALHRTKDLVSWEDGDILEPHSLKGIVAEYAACVGPKIAREAVMDFS
ncbi:hypothetical protein MBLNU459_g7964t1 [Dothideomycetes sp. NU459]